MIFDEVDVFHTIGKDLVSHIEKFAEYNKGEPDAELGYAYTYTFEDIGISLWGPNVFKEETLQETWFQQLTQEEKEDETKYRYFEAISVWSKGYLD